MERTWDTGLETWLRSSTTHGYTGHEMAESVGVIHMNGRLYEPTLARFLQSDPFVQSPQDRQSWNRYSYAFNNPLAYTDPSGNMSVGDALRTVAAIAIMYYAPYLAPYLGGSTTAAYVVGGFAAGAVQTGTLKGAVTSAVTAGAFSGIGSAFSYGNAPGLYENSTTMTFSGYAAKTLSHGIAGGVMAEMQGGRFGHGFASAGVSAALSPAIGRIQSAPAQMIAMAVVGGTTSRLAGGKFANGAVTAAFGYAFGAMARNAAQDHTGDQRMAAAAYGDPKYWMAWEPPALPQGVVDFAAGAGDIASFGLTQYIRERWDIDGAVNYGSDAYSNGMIAGIPASVGTVMAGGVAINIGIRGVGGAATLYHFTSATGAAGIEAAGAILPSSGIMGTGVYATSVNSSLWAFGATSTEVLIPFSTTGLRVGAGLWPGTFRVIGSVPIP